MNCKPGDLAVVVNASEVPANAGKIVRVTHINPLVLALFGKLFWEFEGELLADDGSPCDLVDDTVLRPIRDNDGEDETLTWAGKPKKHTVDEVTYDMLRMYRVARGNI